MQISPSIVASARSKGDDRVARQAPGERWNRVDDVVDLLLASTSPMAQPGSRILLYNMAHSERWIVVRGIHGSRADSTPHVTIQIGGARYHLRVDAQGRVFDITERIGDETRRIAGSEPWKRPGA